MALVETTGAAARSARDFRSAVSVVLEDVATAAGWRAAHAWVPDTEPGQWVSSRLWFPDDGIGLGGLREACTEAPAAGVRGHLALALHMQATQFAADLGALRGTPIGTAAEAAGMVAAIACPVVVRGEAVAILEWYTGTSTPPPPDMAHVLGHLSSVLSEVHERPVFAPPAQRTYGQLRETLRWVTEDGVLTRLLHA
jgi:hypothetical protein